MKKLLFLLLLLLAGGGVFYACQQHEPVQPADGLAKFPIPAVLTNASAGGLAIPNGTRTVLEDGGSRVRFVLPAGVYYVKGGEYTTNFIDNPTEAGYTCTGNCREGCDVFYVGGSFACSQCKDGQSCTGRSGIRADDGDGFLDMAAGITFLTSREDAQALSKSQLQAPRDLFKYARVVEELKKFNQQVHGVNDPSAAIARNPVAYRNVAINLFGCLASYSVPVAYLEAAVKAKGAAAKDMTYNSLFFTAAAAKSTTANFIDEPEADFSCGCVDANSGCTKDSGMGYKKCTSGNCISCKMVVD